MLKLSTGQVNIHQMDREKRTAGRVTKWHNHGKSYMAQGQEGRRQDEKVSVSHCGAGREPNTLGILTHKRPGTSELQKNF